MQDKIDREQQEEIERILAYCKERLPIGWGFRKDILAHIIWEKEEYDRFDVDKVVNYVAERRLKGLKVDYLGLLDLIRRSSFKVRYHYQSSTTTTLTAFSLDTASSLTLGRDHA